MNCSHRQAEPVILTTGERISCVCVECLARLPADYVEQQLTAAHQQATCSHEDAEYVMQWGSSTPTRKFCTGCTAELAAAAPTSAAR